MNNKIINNIRFIQTTSKLILLAIILAVIPSCDYNSETNPYNSDSINAANAKPIATTTEEYCFLATFNKDSTFVNLTISGSNVNGIMHWQPYQKDGAIGILTGKRNSNGEMELLYDYMIEGNKQTETKIMKLEDGKLLIKKGELLDPNNDGHLIFKDASKATYSEVLEKVDCKLTTK